jgi:hypothetical protein
MSMMRWFLVALTLFGFALAIVSKSPGWLGFGIVLGFVGLFGTVFSLAADRVSAAARPESAMATAEDLVAMRTRRAVSAVKPAPPAAKPGPPVATRSDQAAPQ